MLAYNYYCIEFNISEREIRYETTIGFKNQNS